MCHHQHLNKTQNNISFTFLNPPISDVKLIQDNIFDVQHADPRFKNVKVVLVTPQDSRSGITNPVEYILHEGDGE